MAARDGIATQTAPAPPRLGSLRRYAGKAETILSGYLAGGGATSMTVPQFGALLPILARHAVATDSWFLLWDGHGDLNQRAFPEHGPKVRHPDARLLPAARPASRLCRLP